MGKFDRALIACDFDNTLVFTEDVFLNGGEMPTVSEKNRCAIQYFMENGGTFCIATGRALPSFLPLVSDIPMNGPSIIANGAAIYDCVQGKFLETAFMQDNVRERIKELEHKMSPLTYEIYLDDDRMFAVHPNTYTANHTHLTHLPSVELQSIDQAPSPISKLLFEDAPERISVLEKLLLAQPWITEYEMVRSTSVFLELTAHGANKGGMLRRLVKLAGKELAHTYCVGDHGNDISMLSLAAGAFAPSNAIASVKAVKGVHILPDCRDDAIAAMIAQIDKLY